MKCNDGCFIISKLYPKRRNVCLGRIEPYQRTSCSILDGNKIPKNIYETKAIQFSVQLAHIKPSERSAFTCTSSKQDFEKLAKAKVRLREIAHCACVNAKCFSLRLEHTLNIKGATKFSI